MPPRIRPIALVVLGLAGAGALTGCKTVCQKAIDHMVGCMEDYCADNPEADPCQQLAERGAEAPECTEEAARQSEAMLDQDCSVLTSAFNAYTEHAGAARRVEATTNVRHLANSATYYYETERVTPTGQLLAPQFPGSVRRTPSEVPCGETVSPNESMWDAPSWSALNFALRDPHNYSYQFDAWGEGGEATFTASAFGDLDCDGLLSTFVIRGSVVGHQVTVGQLETYSESE